MSSQGIIFKMSRTDTLFFHHHEEKWKHIFGKKYFDVIIEINSVLYILKHIKIYINEDFFLKY